MKKGASPFDKDKTNERKSLFMKLLENKKISIKTSDMLLSLIPEKERSLLNFKFI